MKACVYHLRSSILLISTIILLMSCVDHKERYKDPEWLGGSNIETLEALGNYDIYLKLMEKANYKESVSKILYTLFVPSDDLFEQYFAENGIQSVDDLTEDEAYQLFTLHVLVNPRSRYQLIYEYVWSEEQGPTGEYASLFFRKQTPSRSTPYKEYVKYHRQYAGDSLTIYTGDKYVPLWSKDYFEDFFAATDGSDYKFIYPNSNYDVSSPLANQAMNWHNAMVIPNPSNPDELGVRTSSGFIYFIDQVVSPMPSIEEYMRKNLDKYGLFYDLMQRFADYGSPVVDENRNVRYRKSYDGMANIADDAGPASGPQFRMKDMFTAFIPRNEVLQQYLDEKILSTYGHIDSIPEITLSYILRSNLNQSMGLISKMEQGFFNDFGDPLVVTKDMINSGFMCSNGILYDMKKVLEPNAFTSVTGELFFNKDYSTFLFAVNNAGLISTLSSPLQKVTIFAPSNDQLEAANIRYNTESNKMEYRGPDMVWRTMLTDQLTEFVQNHIAYTKLDDMSGDGFVKMSSNNYIHYNNNVIEGPENQYLNDSVTIIGSEQSTENGILYGINNVIKSRYYSMGKLIWFDPDLSLFAEYLDATRLLNRRIKDPKTKELTPRLKFTASSEAWTVFAPTNAAMEEGIALGIIPDPKTDRDSCQKFLQYHFIRDNVIFDDGNSDGKGSFPTQTLAPVVPNGDKYLSVQVNNSEKNMTVTDGQGNVIKVEHSIANNLAQKAVIHKINSILRY